MDICFLNNLTQDQIIQGSFPLEEILKDSLFYPACGYDGGVIKYCNTLGRDLNINSYVYCDYHVKEETVCNKIETEILGYHVFAHKILAEEELPLTQLKSPSLSFTVDDQIRYMDNIKGVTPYCHWFVLLRDGDYDESHGPLRFSLLFICAEGVAAYAGLYNANEVAPKAVAIIQPGHGFGRNWTDFTNENDYLARIMKQNPVKMPDYIFYGGLWSVRSSWDYMDLNWSFYKNIAVINDYYNSGNGRVVIYKNRRDNRIKFDDLMNKDYRK